MIFQIRPGGRRHVRFGAALAFVVASMGAASVADDAAVSEVHFALARSAPAADSTVPAPAEVQLWFTEPPTAGSLSVRLTNARGELVETSARTAENDAKEIHVAPTRPLGAGRYAVEWRGIGDDGHVVQGAFGFTVAAE